MNHKQGNHKRGNHKRGSHKQASHKQASHKRDNHRPVSQTRASPRRRRNSRRWLVRWMRSTSSSTLPLQQRANSLPKPGSRSRGSLDSPDNLRPSRAKAKVSLALHPLRLLQWPKRPKRPKPPCAKAAHSRGCRKRPVVC